MPIEAVFIEKSKFGSEASLIERCRPQKQRPPPKLNLKMRKSDVRIVDSIATQAKTTRLQILNELVEAVLRRMLNEMHTKDRHCAYLLARVADVKSGHDQGRLSGWQEHLFADDEHHNDYWNQEWQSADDNNELSKEYRELAARLSTPER